MKKTLLISCATLCVGVALGYFLRPEPSRELNDDDTYKPQKAISDKGEAAGLKALRARVREFERQLAAQKEKATAENIVQTPNEEGRNDARRGGPGSRRNMREEIERLKREKPELYQQITNRMANWRQRRLDRARSKLEFFSSINTSGMSAAEKKTHGELQELIARREELESKMHQEDLTDEERHQLFREMHETDRQMRELNQQERTTLFRQTATNLGFQGDDVSEIAETLQEVVEMTEGNRRGPGGPGGPDGPGGPGGSGGPGGPGVPPQ